MVEVAQQEIVVGGFVGPTEAKVNLTWAGQNYDLTDPVPYDIPEEQLRAALSEVIRAGDDGIPADQDVAMMANFVVRRYEPTATRPSRLITVRPKTEFG